MIIDRTLYNVRRRHELSTKGWSAMTTDERKEWNGNPFDFEGANLMACGPFYSSVVELKYYRDEIVARTSSAGVYLYAISIIGNAPLYENKTFTLSVDGITAPSNVSPQIALYWHDDNGFEYAGASLSDARSVVVNTAEFPNTNRRQSLALYVYVTTFAEAVAGDEVRYKGIMFEQGSTRHAYTPYTEVMATNTTKGAYNYSDLNRVERAVAEISDRAGLGLATKTDWTMWDVPTTSDMERYLGNIVQIRTHFSIETELPTSMSNLTYTYANNIEKILSAAYERIRGDAL